MQVFHLIAHFHRAAQVVGEDDSVFHVPQTEFPDEHILFLDVQGGQERIEAHLVPVEVIPVHMVLVHQFPHRGEPALAFRDGAILIDHRILGEVEDHP